MVHGCQQDYEGKDKEIRITAVVLKGAMAVCVL